MAGQNALTFSDAAFDNQGTAMRNVRSIPTLLVFKGGAVVEQRVGAAGKADVQKMLDAHVA